MCDLGNEVAANINFLTGQDHEAIKRSSALLLLKLKEHHRLSQAAIDTVVEGCKGPSPPSRDIYKQLYAVNLLTLGLI